MSAPAALGIVLSILIHCVALALLAPKIVPADARTATPAGKGAHPVLLARIEAAGNTRSRPPSKSEDDSTGIAATGNDKPSRNPGTSGPSPISAPKFLAPPDFSAIDHYPYDGNFDVTAIISVTRYGTIRLVDTTATHAPPEAVLELIRSAIWRSRLAAGSIGGKPTEATIQISIRRD